MGRIQKIKQLRIKSFKKKTQQTDTEPTIVGVFKNPRGIRKFSRYHAAVMVVVFAGAGYLVFRTFAATPCAEVCVILPEGDSVKSEDFHIQTKVVAKQDRSEFNVKVILDQGTPTEQVVDIRKRSSTLKTGEAVTYNFYFGSLASGGGTNLVFDRNLLTPGRHTVTAELRTGDIAAQGTLYSSHQSAITVTNVKNLMTQSDAAKTFYTKQFPLYGTTTPRVATAATSSQRFVLPSIDAAQAVKSLNPEGVASAHAETGARHGHLYVTAYRKIGDNAHAERLPGVGIHLDRDCDGPVYNGSSRDATTRSTGAGTADNGTAYFTNCPVDRTTNVGTYNVSVSGVPAGYHMADVQMKTVQIRWAGEVDRSELTFILEKDTTTTTCSREKVRWFHNSFLATGEDHFYTMDQNFPNGTNGYAEFGNPAWYAYRNNPGGLVPFYRMWNGAGNVQNHFYTTNETERQNVKYYGWVDEGIEGWISQTQQPGTVPVYRSQKRDIHDFYYTTNYQEYQYFYGAAQYYPWPDTNGNPVIGYVWPDAGCTTSTAPTSTPSTTTTNYSFTPTSVPLISLTGLDATKAIVDLFGAVGMDSNGYPSVKTLSSVTAAVDGRVTDSHSLAGRDANTLIGESVVLGNLADGLIHDVSITVTSLNGKTSNISFKTDPYGPYSEVQSERASAVAKTSMSSDDTSSNTTNYGTIQVTTWKDTLEGDGKFRVEPLSDIKLFADRVGTTTPECATTNGISKYVPKTKNSRFTFTNCPVAQSVGVSNYIKAYQVEAVIPSGYHIDKNFAHTTGAFTYFAADGAQRVSMRVFLHKGETKDVTMSFVPNNPGVAYATIPVQQVTGTSSLNDADYDTSIEDRVYVLINNIREKNGLKPLTGRTAQNPSTTNMTSLKEVARRSTKDMAIHGTFSHTGYDCSDLTSRVKKLVNLDKINGWGLGENIAYGTGVVGTPESIVDAWMQSTGHRKNILDPEFTGTGIAVYVRKDPTTPEFQSCSQGGPYSSSNVVYYTQLFSTGL